MAQNLTFIQAIAGRARLNIAKAIQEAKLKAQWHTTGNDHDQRRANATTSQHERHQPDHTNHIQGTVIILVASTDLGTHLVHAALVDHPQDIIDKFSRTHGHNNNT
eukprot:625053-Heterocapsa_arctica.AAC.1